MSLRGQGLVETGRQVGPDTCALRYPGGGTSVCVSPPRAGARPLSLGEKRLRLLKLRSLAIGLFTESHQALVVLSRSVAVT